MDVSRPQAFMGAWHIDYLRLFEPLLFFLFSVGMCYNWLVELWVSLEIKFQCFGERFEWTYRALTFSRVPSTDGRR